MRSPVKLIIKGMTLQGKPFRPSDWAERLCGVTSAFGPENKLKYSPYVQPMTVGGVKSVVVEAELSSLEPRLYQFLLSFAKENELQVDDVDHVCAMLDVSALIS